MSEHMQMEGWKTGVRNDHLHFDIKRGVAIGIHWPLGFRLNVKCWHNTE